MKLDYLKKIIISSVIIAVVLFSSQNKVSSSYPKIASENAPMEEAQILILIENEFNLPEYFDGISQFESYGCNITIAGPRATIISDMQIISVDLLFTEVNVVDFDCIYIPGGVSAELLCLIPNCLSLIQSANALGICLAAVCAGPLVFAAADIVNGRNVTGNILIKNTLAAAGGIFIDGGQCVRDNNLLTADGPYLFDMIIEITKVLGFYESDPPEIGSVYHQITNSDLSFNIYLEVKVTDVFGVGLVQAQIYKYGNDDEKSLYTSAQLTDPDEDNIFSKNILGLDPGKYVIDLTVIDILTNEYTNTSLLEFTINDTHVSGWSLFVISTFSVLIGIFLIIIRQKNNMKI